MPRLAPRSCASACLFLLGVLAMLAPPIAGAAGRNGSIAFSRWFCDGEVSALFRSGFDGSAERRLTSSRCGSGGFPATTALLPRWRPSHGTLSFLYGRAPSGEAGGPGPSLVETSPAGNDRRVLGRAGTDDFRWAPDGRRIASVFGARIYLGTPSRPRRKVVADGTTAGWSPDGKRLAAVEFSRPDDCPVVSIFDAGDARRLRTLTAGNLDRTGCDDRAYAIDWSPDGRRLVFTSTGSNRKPGAPRDVFLIDPSGRHRQQVTSSPGDEGQPTWSPDGRWILFTLRPRPVASVDLWRMRPDGSCRTRVARDVAAFSIRSR